MSPKGVLKTRTLRGGRVVPGWYFLVNFELSVFGFVLLVIGLIRAEVRMIVIGGVLMVLCQVALRYAGPFGDRPYGR
jgi:hypothetical protein